MLDISQRPFAGHVGLGEADVPTLRKRLFSICGQAEFWRVQVRRNSVMYGREKLALAIGRRWSLEIDTSGISLMPI
jgi:hypothetical protein